LTGKGGFLAPFSLIDLNTLEVRLMDMLDNKTDKELLESLVAEIAKATNEIKCARGDIDKAQSRIKFLLVLAHELIYRQKD